MNRIWCNGEFHEGPLTLAPSDRALCHGLGLFETLLALDGRPVAFSMHLDRLRSGAARLGWETPRLSPDIVAGLLERQNLTEGRARVRISVGAGSGDLRNLERGKDSKCWITASPCPDGPESVSLITVPFPRNERSPLAGLKSLSYAENLIALETARNAGADEALFLNSRGEVCEASTANLFVVRDGGLATPPLSSGCLAGTARARLCDLARSAGILVTEEVIFPQDLERQAVFLTSATRGVTLVHSIDGKALAPEPEAVETLRREWVVDCLRRRE